MNRGNCDTSNLKNGVIKLPVNQQKFENADIALYSISIPYSWYNISTALNNTTFNLSFCGLSIDITLPDSNFEIDTLNQYLQFVMYQNGLYLVDSTATEVFYLSLQMNATLYGATLAYTVLPATLPAGWSNPAALDLITYGGTCPVITFDNSEFSTFLGFNPSTSIPAVNTATGAITSPNTPDVRSISTVNVGLNLVENPILLTRDIYSFSPSEVGFTDYYTQQVPFPIFYRVINGSYNEIVINFTDQLGRPVQVNDPDISITLIFKQHKDDE
jgi:hypothetical protein